ncbi:MAG: molybdopterin converting factor subunit 1 [Cyclobacteriaceae bacterium]|nr:molybdopterin converting factor subunit 1 [Cyclobacteriaceae bacterium]
MIVKLFGVTREIVGGPLLEVNDIATVGELKDYVMSTYPGIKKLNSLMVAVNSEYAKDDLTLNENDEIALIPPVSGG